MPDEFLTTSEAAKLLNVRIANIRRLLQKKKWPGTKSDSGRWRISMKALLEYVDKGGLAAMEPPSIPQPKKRAVHEKKPAGKQKAQRKRYS